MQLHQRNHRLVQGHAVEVVAYEVGRIPIARDRGERTDFSFPVDLESHRIDFVLHQLIEVGFGDERRLAAVEGVHGCDVAVIVYFIVGKLRFQILGRRPAQGNRHSVVVNVTGALAATEVDVVPVAVTLLVGKADLHRQLVVDERHIESGFERLLVVIAIETRHCKTPFVELGRNAGDADGPAGGVLAEQHALRAAVHFNLCDVERVHQLASIRAELHTIDDRANTWRLGLLRARIANSANEYGATLSRGGIHRNEQIGHCPIEVAKGPRRHVLDIVFGKCRDGDRYVLCRFRNTTGGNNDLFDPGSGLLGRDGRADQCCGHRDDRADGGRAHPGDRS